METPEDKKRRLAEWIARLNAMTPEERKARCIECFRRAGHTNPEQYRLDLIAGLQVALDKLQIPGFDNAEKVCDTPVLPLNYKDYL